MQHRQAGFSGIEILVVLVMGGILLGMAIPAFGRANARRGAQSARDALVSLAARARTVAIEQGSTVNFEVDPANDRAWFRVGTDTIQVVDYSGEFDADVTLARNAGLLSVCLTPRGFARTCTAVLLPDTATFARGAYSARAEIRVLGQVLKL